MSYTTLVLSGGGVRGIALLGALWKLRETKQIKHVKTVVGISVGSLIATAIVMGIPEREVYEKILQTDVAGLRRTSVLNLMSRFGLDTGTRMIHFIREFFTEHGFSPHITFAQLNKISGQTLKVGASNVDDGTLYFFSHENEPNCQIAHALRMSCGIPFVFTMWKHNGHSYVDGAVKDNFPIQQVLNEDSKSEILGINLRDDCTVQPHPVSDFIDYADRIHSMMARSLDEQTMKNLPPQCDVIEIRCEKTSLLHVSLKVKERLYDLGVQSADQFIRSKSS